MANTQQEVLSVGTLNKDASLFFNQMENLIGSSRLQHTPSMMTLPAGFLQKIISERDEEMEEQDEATPKRRGRTKRGNDGDEKDNGDDDEEYESDDEEFGTDDEYDDEQGSTHKRKPKSDADAEHDGDRDDNDGDDDQVIEQIELDSPRSPTIQQPKFGRWSKKKEKLNLRSNDSEGYDQQPPDTTPIVRPIKPPRSSLSAADLAATRRRSDGFSQRGDNTLITKFRPSQKAKSQQALQNIADEEQAHGDEEYDEEREELELIDAFLNDDNNDADFLDEYYEEEKKRTSVKKARNMGNVLKRNDSMTMHTDIALWQDIGDDDDGNNTNFTECNIRFEEDDWIKDGRKPPASEFCSLRFFFQFVYDRFHLYSQFLLDTSLPMYSEWKKMRSVRYRNASLKAVDYALKSCIQCVDSIKAVVRNCIILFFDNEQPHKEYTFAQCQEPKILSTTFNVGIYSIMAAWDLFDNGSTPSVHDWSVALSLDHGGNAQKLSSCLPDLTHLATEMKSVSLAYHNGKSYKFLILSEFLNENASFLKFGAGPIEWKLIKQKFIEKHGQKYNNGILRAFDQLSYYVNPPLTKLNDLMSDKNDKFVSRRRIVAEPIMWLYYMVSFLIERQEKLQNLYITAMSFKGDNNNKGHKLNALITNLAKQAKDESERLRAVMAKLPGKDDLKQTLIELVKQRDSNNQTLYAQSLSKYTF